MIKKKAFTVNEWHLKLVFLPYNTYVVNRSGQLLKIYTAFVRRLANT
jgi:hypothetical protein